MKFHHSMYKHFNYIKLSILLIIFSIGLNACSDNSTDPDTNTPGDAEVTITGAIEGEHEGWGLFNHTELPQGETWGITLTNNNTFHVQISISTLDGTATEGSVSRPSPGSYVIGRPGTGSSVYVGIYTDIESGGVGAGADYEYSTLHEDTGGTLTIESSTDESVEGYFEFEAAHDADEQGNAYGFVTVSGEFSATNQDLVD